jgi:Spy/CpxP family protein refolding chaperone
MKINGIKTSVLIIVLVLATITVNAQRGHRNNRGCNGKGNSECRFNGDSMGAGPNCQIPGLTADQQKEIKKLRIAFQKEALQLKNQLAEKRARLQTLKTAEKTDLAAIDKTIDEMTAIKAQLMKKKLRHEQDVKAQLNDEQKLFFDTKGPKNGKQGKGRGGKGGKCGKGMKQCDGSGPHGDGRGRGF